VASWGPRKFLAGARDKRIMPVWTVTGNLWTTKGQKEKAIKNYTKFLDLWKDADPGIPEVEYARKRLAALGNKKDHD